MNNDSMTNIVPMGSSQPAKLSSSLMRHKLVEQAKGIAGVGGKHRLSESVAPSQPQSQPPQQTPPVVLAHNTPRTAPQAEAAPKRRTLADIVSESQQVDEGKAGKKVWAHHPRGGIVTGYASKQYHGLYGPEHKIAPTKEAAKAGNGMSFPAHQVHVGEPPAQKKESVQESRPAQSPRTAPTGATLAGRVLSGMFRKK